MYKKIVIGSTERALLYKDKQFSSILKPGTYRFVSPLRSLTVEVFDISRSAELSGGIAKVLLSRFDAELEKDLVRVATSAREVAVVYMNARAAYIVAPGEERLFWRGLNEVRVERFDISVDYELSQKMIRDLASVLDETSVLSVKVPEQYTGLLLDAGVIVRVLSPGMYAFWRAQRSLSASVFDTRLNTFEVSGQEILTKDKVSLRLNLTVSYRLVDVARATRAMSDMQGEIYRGAQLALRQAVGEKTLDELLENKDVLNRTLTADISTPLAAFGIEVSRVGVKDIILPGDMRLLFNQVVEAEKAAQAQNIRRREETAATRSLLNTAKMMESNPILLRLKELEAVERISEKIEKLTVFDGLDGVMKGLVSLGK